MFKINHQTAIFDPLWFLTPSIPEMCPPTRWLGPTQQGVGLGSAPCHCVLRLRRVTGNEMVVFFTSVFLHFSPTHVYFLQPHNPPFLSNFSYPRRFRARSLLCTHVRPFGLYKRTRKHPSARSGLRWPENCIQPSPKLLKLQLLSRKRSSCATASSASWGGL